MVWTMDTLKTVFNATVSIICTGAIVTIMWFVVTFGFVLSAI